MAEDIKLVIDTSTFSADIKFENEDFVRESGLETAILLSLFLDKRANADDILDNEKDKRGWWGDWLDKDTTGDKIGSRLWLLERAATTQQNLIRAQEYAEEALQWLIEDGVAVKIEVTAERLERQSGDILLLTVNIYKKFGETETFKFDALWNAQFAN